MALCMHSLSNSWAVGSDGAEGQSLPLPDFGRNRSDTLSFKSRVSIVPGLFQFLSPGTFGLVQSRDHGTTGPSRSLGPVLSSPGTQDLLVPGVPGPSRDQIIFCYCIFCLIFLFCCCCILLYQEQKSKKREKMAF